MSKDTTNLEAFKLLAEMNKLELQHLYATTRGLMSAVAAGVGIFALLFDGTLKFVGIMALVASTAPLMFLLLSMISRVKKSHTEIVKKLARNEAWTDKNFALLSPQKNRVHARIATVAVLIIWLLFGLVMWHVDPDSFKWPPEFS